MVFEALPRRAGVAPYFLTGHIPHIAARGAVVFWQLSIGIGALMLRGQGGGIGELFYVMSTDSVSVSTFFDVYVC